VQDKGADFLLTAKGNQPGVAKNAQQLYNGLSGVFFSRQPKRQPPKPVSSTAAAPRRDA
jgi:hypothetical protein